MAMLAFDLECDFSSLSAEDAAQARKEIQALLLAGGPVLVVTSDTQKDFCGGAEAPTRRLSTSMLIRGLTAIGRAIVEPR